MTWIRKHFQRYLDRRPWDFCWRIGVESTVVSLLAAALLVSIFGEGTPRELQKLPIGALFVFLIIVAPPIETLALQAFPIFIVRLLKGSIRTQILISTVLFAACHFPEGLVPGISAGIIGGFYFGFSYAHWRTKSRWKSLWITTVCHGIHNGIALILIVIFENLA